MFKLRFKTAKIKFWNKWLTLIIVEINCGIFLQHIWIILVWYLHKWLPIKKLREHKYNLKYHVYWQNQSRLLPLDANNLLNQQIQQILNRFNKFSKTFSWVRNLTDQMYRSVLNFPFHIPHKSFLPKLIQNEKKCDRCAVEGATS